MNRLRAKILTLFNFPHNVTFTLRYPDEDGDTVTLVDDEDLRDVMRQRLKFLKLDVLLLNENGGKDHISSQNIMLSTSQLTQADSISPKLYSSFVCDITVMDGTMIAPFTQFTKIWRMRNNGDTLWAKGTQLLWIGGERFFHVDSVELEIPENGVCTDGELDIAVDFTAPELPGRYISHWMMASSSGQKFGQLVRVLIQVDTSVRDSLRGLNLNLPYPISSKSKAKNKSFSSAKDDLVETYVMKVNKEKEDVEHVMLHKLNDMGFKQVDLNKKILRFNDYNFEHSVDDLSVATGWDYIVQELEEMGFGDRELNKLLLMENNGNKKCVVMDLIC